MSGLGTRWRATSALLAAGLSVPTACSTINAPNAADTSAEIRAIERERLMALVAADQSALERLHADDFQVVSPLGSAFAKGDYIPRVISGQLDYLRWEPQEIEVRLYGSVAAIRYRALAEVVSRGTRLPTMETWNTGLYERRKGRWSIVWFQVTEISPPRR